MTEVLEKTQKIVTVKPPCLWDVVFYDDDITPKSWVIKLLRELFNYEQAAAEKMADFISDNGSKSVATYPKSIAEQMAVDCMTVSRRMGYPLKVVAEREAK